MGIVMTAFLATLGVALALAFLVIVAFTLAVVGGWLADLTSQDNPHDK